MWRNVIIGVLLAIVTYSVYAPMKQAEFINFDDPGYVSENRNVQEGLTPSNIWWAISTSSEFNWHPLTWLSYMADNDFYKWYLTHYPQQPLFKIRGMAGGFHLTSILIHVASSVLLFLVMLRLTRLRWASAVVAALFALHPQHAESVAWIAERKDVLGGFFWILTLGAYALYGQCKDDRRPALYGLVLACLALGLMAKPMVVTLPFVLLLLDVWPLRRIRFTEPGLAIDEAAPPAPRQSRKKGKPVEDVELDVPDEVGPVPLTERLWRQFDAFWNWLGAIGAGLRQSKWVLLEKAPMLAMIAASSIVTFIVQQRGGAMTYAQRCPFGMRLMNAPVSYITYMYKTFVPKDFSVFYPYNHDRAPIETAAALLFLGTITGLVLWQLRRRPYLSVGWFWFLGTLVPVIGIVQVGAQAMADRYAYIPTMGLYLAVVYGLAIELARWRDQKWASVPLAAGAALLGAIVVAFWIVYPAWLAFPHNRQWLSENASWLLGLSSPVGGVLAMAVLAAVVALVWWHGRRWALGPMAAGALVILIVLTIVQVSYWPTTRLLFFHSLDIEPQNAVAHCNLGESMFLRGEYAEAEVHFRAALAIDDEQTGAHNNLGWSLARRGLIDEAIVHYKRSLEIDPKNAAAHNNYALALVSKNRTDEAIEHLKIALGLEENYAAARNNLGMIYAEHQQYEEAAKQYRAAMEISPTDTVARGNLAMVLSAQDKPDEAIALLTEAIRMTPNSASLHSNLGLVFCRINKFNEALSEYAEALRLEPNNVGIRNNYGMALASMNRFDEAMEQFRLVLKIDPAQPEARMTLVQLLRAHGTVEEVVRVLREGLTIHRDWPQALSLLAWILATDSRFLNPEEAIALATQASDLTQRRDASTLDSLAAAYAAAGKFPLAVVTAEAAVALAADRPDIANPIKYRLQLYQKKQAFRVNP
jgi:protein O-mannosyl-transferase